MVDSFSTHLFSKDWSSDPSPLSIGLGSIEKKAGVVFKSVSKEKKKKRRRNVELYRSGQVLHQILQARGPSLTSASATMGRM